MPNILDSSGLRLNTYDEWQAYLVAGFKRIYGDDVNLDSASPDGQFINLIIQILLDSGDLIRNIYSSFDPDQAFGASLDQRLALNGIRRQSGSYTVTNITVEITKSTNLVGLDNPASGSPYTIQDIEGNKWFLENSRNGLVPENSPYELSFRAAEKGRLLTTPNTINTQSTIVLGVKSLNNPLPAVTIGADEELDQAVKIRRQKSVALASTGYNASLESALKNLPGIVDATVYENDESVTNADGIPPHTIWVIVDGSAEDSEIADVIYRKRNAGCGTYGGKQFQIPRKNQPAFVVRWNYIQPEVYFMKFKILPINPSKSLDLTSINSELLYNQLIGEVVDIGKLSTIVSSIDSNALVVESGLSNGSQQSILFLKAPTTGTITIGYLGGSVELVPSDITGALKLAVTKLKTIPGLGNCTITITNVNPAIIISIVFPANSLPVAMVRNVINNLDTAIQILLENTAPIARQRVKNYRLTASKNTVVLNTVIISSPSSTIPLRGTFKLTAIGGYGNLVFTFFTNASGGTLNALTGDYVAGSTAGNDIIVAIDRLGNVSNQLTITAR